MTVPGAGYQLDVPRTAVDAARFEDLSAQGRAALEADEPERASRLLSEALALWRGEVLSDLSDLGFVDSFSRRLTEVRLAATEDWVEAELAQGHHASLVPELGRLVRQNPLRERLQGQRMLALYRSSRQVDALAAYRTVRAVLGEELGIDPGPELQALHERMLRQDPGLAPRHTGADESRDGVPVAADEAAGSSTPPTSPGGRRVRAPRLRGRGRRGLALAAVVALAAVLIGAGTYRIARSGEVTPLPPNSVGAVTLDGVDGEAIEVGASPVALTHAGGSVWVADQGEQSVVRIDPTTRRVVQRIHGVGTGPEAIASSGQDVWVAAGTDGSIARINIAASKLVSSIPVGAQPAAVAASPTAVWVANSGDNTVQRIDPVTGKADKAIPVGDGPDGLALDGTTLWIANGRSGTLTQLDTRTGERAAEDILVDAGPSAIAVTSTDVWVANQLAQSVSRVSRATGRVTRISVEDGPSSLLVTGDAAWVGNAYAGSLSRIDAATNAVVTVKLGSSPRALARVGAELWAAAGAFSNAEHIGGTLTVTTQFRTDTLDPAGAYSSEGQALLRPVYDGLVRFRAAGGRRP